MHFILPDGNVDISCGSVLEEDVHTIKEIDFPDAFVLTFRAFIESQRKIQLLLGEIARQRTFLDLLIR